MEVKKHKNTFVPKLRFKEFGDDWKPELLGNICRVTTGSKDTQNRIDNGTYPFFVRSNTVERINSYSFDGEAILTSGDGVGVGKNFHYINDKFDFHQRVYALLEFKENYSGKFIYQLFVEKFHKRVMRLSAKNSVDSVRMNMITEMSIAFPTLPEQQKIASFLSVVDEKMQLLNRKKIMLEQYKKSVVQQLFSRKLRFKDEKGKTYPKWEEKKMGEIGKFYAGGDLDKLDYRKIKEGQYIYPIYANGAGEGLYGFATTFQFNANCVTVSGRGNLGYANVRNQNFNAIVRLIVIEPEYYINPKFLEEVINNINFVVESTGVPQLTIPQISSYKILIPCFEEQKKVADFLASIDVKIENLNTQINQTQSFKKGLLQQMFV